jgi:hypothetical protein
MTPRKPSILTLGNKTGNGAPAVEDLIAVQTAILTSNATVLGAVTQMQTDVGQRLDRQFGEVTESLSVVEVKVDGLNTRLGCIEEARRTDAALAAQAKGVAATNNADRAAHSLSTNQRMAIVISAIAAVGGVILGLLNFAVGK